MSHNLHGVNATNLSSIVSTPSTPLKNRLETRLDDVQATTASLVEVPKHKCGRSKTERRATHVRQVNRVSRRDKSNSKGKSTRRVKQTKACNHEHCMRPTTDKAERIVYLQGLHRKPEQIPNKSRAMRLRPF